MRLVLPVKKADPYQITRQSTLIKLGFQPNENHRLSVALDDSTLETKGMDLSYVFRPCKGYSMCGKHTVSVLLMINLKEKISNLVMKISVKPLLGSY